MAVTVRIPTPLQSLTGDQSTVEAEGGTIKDVLADLERQYPGLKARLCDEAGRLRPFVNIYVNQEDVRFLQGEETPLAHKDEVSIIPAIAGGIAARRI
jgi:molybdopterin synthase sulfur carrier subunit